MQAMTGFSKHTVAIILIIALKELLMVEPAAAPPGQTALDLDGTNSCVATDIDAGALGIEGNSPRTVEAWVFTRAFDNMRAVFSLGTIGEDGKDFTLRVRDAKNQWRVQYWGRDYDIDFNHPSAYRWVHFALVHAGEESIIYADGKEVARGKVRLNTSPDDPLHIGWWYRDEADAFDGKIAEVRIWDRELDKNEINSHMYRSLKGNERGLVGYWPLNEKNGNIAHDLAGGNHGHLTGRAGWTLSDPFEKDLENKRIDANRTDSLVLGPVSLSNPQGKVNYQWYFEDEPIDGAVDSSLAITEVSEHAAGIYFVKVNDDRPHTPVDSRPVHLNVIPGSLREAATPRPDVPGAARESDVAMRSLVPRPRDEDDPYDTFEAIKGFHVTRLEWTYSSDKDFITRVNELGVDFGGAAGAGSYSGDTPREKWEVRNRKGEIVYAPWMRTWDPPNPWGCANNPEFRRGHLRFMKRIVDAGADLIQRDEPTQNENALNWGGCFCDYCMKGFNEWLEENADGDVLNQLSIGDLKAFDYRDYLQKQNAPVGDGFRDWSGDELKDYFEEFQKESTLEFHNWWRSELNEHAGRHITVSCNNGVRRRSKIESAFDYWIGELRAQDSTPEFIYEAMKKAREHNKTQTTTMPLKPETEATPDWIQLTRKSIAVTYASGGHMEMPWDTFLPTGDADRFFGAPEDYADLSAFVHAISHYLDGYSDALAAGGAIEDDRWPSGREPLTIADDSDSIYAFARVQPGKPEAPVAIHLTDWRDVPESFRLAIRPEVFFGEQELTAALYTPVPYDRQSHEHAFATGDYSDLSDRKLLERGYFSELEIPALSPWGVLVIEPSKPHISSTQE